MWRQWSIDYTQGSGNLRDCEVRCNISVKAERPAGGLHAASKQGENSWGLAGGRQARNG